MCEIYVFYVGGLHLGSYHMITWWRTCKGGSEHCEPHFLDIIDAVAYFGMTS